MDDLEQIPVGTDRFRAQVIAEACRDEGLEVELLMSDDTYFYAEIRLLAHADQLEQVLAVVQKSDNTDAS